MGHTMETVTNVQSAVRVLRCLSIFRMQRPQIAFAAALAKETLSAPAALAKEKLSARTSRAAWALEHPEEYIVTTNTARVLYGTNGAFVTVS